MSNTTGLATFTGTSGNYSAMSWRIGSATLANIALNQVVLSGVKVTGQTFGSWADLTSASFTETNNAQPCIYYQPSAVP